MALTRGAMIIPRSRGATTGFALLLLGIWGAIIPFVGPYFNYSFGSYATWHFTLERLWLDIVPGVAVLVGGVLLIRSATRPTAAVGGWLAMAAGAWFVVGVPLSTIWEGSGHVGIGPPLGGHVLGGLEQIGFFYGLGTAIVLLAAFALGRLSVRSVRDVRAAETRTGEAVARGAEPHDRLSEEGASGGPERPARSA